MRDKLKGVLPEVDIDKAMEYCGGDDFILQVALESYCEQDFSGDLGKFFEAKDIPNYQILVHGVKSTSLTIGLCDLSEKAKQLEQACKDNNWDYIEANHEEMLAKYADVLAKIKSIL